MSTIVNIQILKDGQVVDQKSFNKEAVKIGGRASSDIHLDGDGVHLGAVVDQGLDQGAGELVLPAQIAAPRPRARFTQSKINQRIQNDFWKD